MGGAFGRGTAAPEEIAGSGAALASDLSAAVERARERK
jgi:hypothetical protein